MELSKRTMKAKALAIAGALSVVSIALPLSAKAQDQDPFEYWYAFTLGAYSTLCDFHRTKTISNEIVKEFQETWMKKIDDEFIGVMNKAVANIRGQEAFKACPLRRY